MQEHVQLQHALVAQPASEALNKTLLVLRETRVVGGVTTGLNVKTRVYVEQPDACDRFPDPPPPAALGCRASL